MILCVGTRLGTRTRRVWENFPHHVLVANIQVNSSLALFTGMRWPIALLTPWEYAMRSLRTDFIIDRKVASTCHNLLTSACALSKVTVSWPASLSTAVRVMSLPAHRLATDWVGHN